MRSLGQTATPLYKRGGFSRRASTLRPGGSSRPGGSAITLICLTAKTWPTGERTVPAVQCTVLCGLASGQEGARRQNHKRRECHIFTRRVKLNQKIAPVISASHLACCEKATLRYRKKCTKCSLIINNGTINQQNQTFFKFTDIDTIKCCW